jgi:hypothetical protein
MVPRGHRFEPKGVVCFLQALRVKRKITLVRLFQEALRHICVTAGM